MASLAEQTIPIAQRIAKLPNLRRRHKEFSEATKWNTAGQAVEAPSTKRSAMDSYNTYRDRERDVPMRSPVRDWDGRDDRKPERGGDSFFRGRSPGA